MRASRMVAAVAAVVCSVMCAPAARAQSAERSGPRVFGGAGLAATSTDLGARMRLASDTPRRSWFIEAGVPVTARIGVGVEFGGPGDAIGETRGISFRSRGRQRERLLMGMLRARVADRGPWGLDIVAGAGALFQRHERIEAPCAICDDFRTERLDRTSPAFVVGADVPVRVARGVWLGAVVRYHLLARGTQRSDIAALVPWQYEWKSSTRFSAGAAVRLGR